MPLIEEMQAYEAPPQKQDSGLVSIDQLVPGEMVSGKIKEVGFGQTMLSNVARGATQAFTAPVEYAGALTGIELLGDAARATEEFVQDLTPVNPDLADSWLATYIPQGLGQVGSMLVPGAAFFKAAQGFKTAAGVAQAAGKAAEAAQLLSKAAKVESAGKVAILSLMGGMEGNDAYQRSIEQGDDHAEAVAKSLGYASVAAAIENKWGTGLLIKRMEGLMGKEAAAEALAKKGLTRRVAEDVATGFAEEASQRLAQDIIVAGQPDAEGIFTEGGVGGIIQGLVGLPMNIAMRSMNRQQKVAIAQAEKLIAAGSPATAQAVLEDALSESLTLEDIGILQPEGQAAEGQPVVGQPSAETKTQIATEPTATPVPPAVIPVTPEVVSELQNNAAPLTAAAIETEAIKPKETDAIPQQFSEKSLLRTEQPQVGLQEMGTGNQGQVAPAQAVPVSSTQEQVVPKPDTLEQDLNDLAMAIQDIRQRIVSREKGVTPNVEAQEMRRQEEGRQEGRVLSPAAPMGVAAEAVTPVAEAGPLSVYTRDYADGKRWLVQEGDKRGFGDAVFRSEQEANDYAAQQDKMRKANAEFRAKAEAQKADEAAKKAEFEKPLTDYLSSLGKNPMESGKLRATLEKAVNRRSAARGKIYSGPAFKAVSEMVADGYKPTIQTVEGKTVYRLEDESGSFWDVTKTEHDFAVSLQSPSTLSPKETVATPPASFPKGTRVVSNRYGKGEVVRKVGKRYNVQFDDGTKFTVSAQELTAEGVTEPTVTQPLSPEEQAQLQSELEAEQTEPITPAEKKAIKTELQSALDEVKDAWDGLYSLGVQPDPEVQLRFYRSLYNLAKIAIQEGIKTAAEFIKRNPFYASVSKTMEKAFEDAQNGKVLPATLDELPPEVVHEMELAGVNVEPKVKEQPKVPKTGQALKSLLESEWAEQNKDLAEILRNQTYDSTTDPKRKAIAAALVDFYGDDLDAALAYTQIPPKDAGVTNGIQQLMFSHLSIKAERANNPMIATIAYSGMKSRRSTMGQDFQAAQAADKMMMDEGSAALWVLRAENDFSDSQREVIEPVISVKEVREVVTEAKKKAAKDIEPDIEKLAKRLFPKGMKEMGATMRSIMEQHADSQEATRKALFDRISNEEAFENLTPQQRLQLANELQTLWEKARNKELQRILKSETKQDAKKKIIENALPKLIKRINAGALSDEAIYNALAEQFGLPSFDEATAKDVFRMAQEMQKAPEGLPRNQKYIDLLNYIAMKRKLSKWETLKAYWYASILSGTGTQATNGIAAAVNVQLQNMLLAATNPRSAGKIFMGAMRGYAVAFNEASAILARGDFSNRITNEVMHESAPLEQLAIKGGPVGKFFSNMKYVSRMMAFVDTLNAMSAMESRAYYLATQQTLGRYKTGEITQAQVDEEIFKLLNVTKEQEAAYRAQAQAEADKGFISQKDVKRRTQNLIRINRPPEIMQEALNYGKVATFNQKPVGFAGKIAQSINALRTNVPIATVVFPFVQTPANVMNELLNYTPAGLWRLAKENPVFRQKVSNIPGLNNLKSRNLSPADYQILRAQVVFGHLAAIGIGMMLASFDDDKDPAFDITGGWYGIDGDRKRQLMAQGKRKWSIKIGDTWIDYRQTPMAIMLGTLGNYQDTKKYGNDRDKALNTSSLAYHGMNGAFIIKDMTFLSGVTELISLINPDDYTPVERRLSSFMSRPVTGLVPTIVQEVDSWFDPEIKRGDTFLGYLQADIPVARSMMDKPMINVLGQVIRDRKNAADRFYNQAEKDPVWQELARLSEDGVFVPVPSATAKVLKNGKRIRMTDDQVYQYRLESGKLYYEKLKRDLPRLKNMDAEQASRYFDKEFPPLRERAKLIIK